MDDKWPWGTVLEGPAMLALISWPLTAISFVFFLAMYEHGDIGLVGLIAYLVWVAWSVIVMFQTDFGNPNDGIMGPGNR